MLITIDGQDTLTWLMSDNIDSTILMAIPDEIGNSNSAALLLERQNSRLDNYSNKIKLKKYPLNHIFDNRYFRVHELSNGYFRVEGIDQRG